MREHVVENYLTSKVAELGGIAFKFVSPGNSGVPDRIVLLPGGRIFFVELKAPGKKQEPLQIYRGKQITKIGFSIFCLDSIEAVKIFLKEAQNDL